MSTLFRPAILAGMLLLQATSGMAAPEPFSCPAQLAKTEQSSSAAPVGWQAIVDEPRKHMLVGFRVNMGPPGSRDGLVPEVQSVKTDKKGVTTETVGFDLKGAESAHALCLYSFTSIALVRSLDGYASCTLTNRKPKDGVFELASAVCR